MMASSWRMPGMIALTAVAVAACTGGDVSWQRDIGAVAQSGAVVVGDVAVVAVGGEDDHAGDLVGLDVTTGDERWRWTAPDRLVAPPHPAVAGELVAVLVPTLAPTQLCAIDAGDGVEHWCVEVDSEALGRGRPTYAHLAGDATQVVATGADGVVRSFDTADGSRRWERELEAPPEGEDRVVTGDLVIVDDVVVAGSGAVVVDGADEDALRGSVAGLDAATGEVLWQVASPLGVIQRHRLTADDGDVIVQSAGRVQKLDAATGAERWDVSVPPPPAGSAYDDAVARPAVVGDLVIALPLATWAFPSDSGVLTAFDRDTGELRWTLPDDTPDLAAFHVEEILAGLGEVDGAPALVGADLSVFDPQDGTVSRTVELGLTWGQPFAGSDGSVVAVDPDGTVVAATPGD